MRQNRLIYLTVFLSILLLYFFENNTGTRMLLLSAAMLPAVSAMLACIASGHIRASLDLPERRKKTDKILGLIETSLSWPGFRVYGNVTLVHSFSGIRKLHVLCQGRHGIGAFELQEHCGAVEGYLDSVECSDLFGLFSFQHPVQMKRVCIIEPSLFPVNSEIIPMEELFAEDGEHESQVKGPDSYEPDGIRDYMPGDRVKSIHWKLSSKADKLLIRENDTLNERTPLLVLDSSVTDDDIRDSLLSAMLSFSNGLFYSQIPHAVGIRGRTALKAASFREAQDWILMGQLRNDSETEEPFSEYASVFVFTDEPEDVPDPDWEGLRIQRIYVRPQNAGENDLVITDMI